MKILNKVVFIDDDPYINEYHKIFSKRIGLAQEVLFFETAEAGLDYLANIKDKYDFPELILVDINMPQMDGHQFVARLNDMAAYNPIRTMVAFLTASRNIEDVIKADEEQVEYYYWKPLNDQLIKKVLMDGFRIEYNPSDEGIILKKLAANEEE